MEQAIPSFVTTLKLVEKGFGQALLHQALPQVFCIDTTIKKDSFKNKYCAFCNQ
jgi:hypothetical protein